MLCGPIKGWEEGFLQGRVDLQGIKELFLDRPLKKQKAAHATSVEAFVSQEVESGVYVITDLQTSLLLPGGNYLTDAPASWVVPVPALGPDRHCDLSRARRALAARVGLLGEEGETNWWGIWRERALVGEKWLPLCGGMASTVVYRRDRRTTHIGTTACRISGSCRSKNGHLRLLEEEAEEHRRWRRIGPGPCHRLHDQHGHGGAPGRSVRGRLRPSSQIQKNGKRIGGRPDGVTSGHHAHLFRPTPGSQSRVERHEPAADAE